MSWNFKYWTKTSSNVIHRMLIHYLGEILFVWKTCGCSCDVFLLFIDFGQNMEQSRSSLSRSQWNIIFTRKIRDPHIFWFLQKLVAKKLLQGGKTYDREDVKKLTACPDESAMLKYPLPTKVSNWITKGDVNGWGWSGKIQADQYETTTERKKISNSDFDVFEGSGDLLIDSTKTGIDFWETKYVGTILMMMVELGWNPSHHAFVALAPLATPQYSHRF